MSVPPNAGGDASTDVIGQAAAFRDSTDILVNWMVQQAEGGDVGEASGVLGLVLDGGLTAEQARRLQAAADGMDERALVALVALLRDVRTWPTRQPELARRFLLIAREVGGRTAASVRAEIAAAMHLGTWGWTDGESPELEGALAAASACAESETDPELREDFTTAKAHFERELEGLRRRHVEDDDD